MKAKCRLLVSQMQQGRLMNVVYKDCLLSCIQN